MHEISFKSLPVLLISTIDLKFLLLLLLQKKKEPSKPHRPTIKSSKVLLCLSQNSRFSQLLLSRGQPVLKERRKEKNGKKIKKGREREKNDEERDACLANN